MGLERGLQALCPVKNLLNLLKNMIIQKIMIVEVVTKMTFFVRL